jgi:sodium pump decarboxylase gamma subunit
MNNIFQGITFMVMGMGVVFIYLIFMVASMNLLKISVQAIAKFFPEKGEEVPGVTQENDETEIAAAITVAYAMKNK